MIKNELLLQELGFSENLSKVYLSLLKYGKCRASSVLRETGLQRSVVYNALDELVKRNIVSKTLVRGVASFSANDPTALVQEAEEKIKVAEKVADTLRNFQGVSNREAVVYEGPEIIQRVANKSLECERDSTVYFLGASKFGIQSSLEKFWKRYHKERIAKGIKSKILYDKDTDPETVSARNSLSLCEAKYMPFGRDLPMWITIFEDHVAMVVPGDEPPLAFVIKSEKTAEGFRKYFGYLWEQ